jgi:hypothetical protein
MNDNFVLCHEQVPEANVLCELYHKDGPPRLARFISEEGLNGTPLWVDEEGKTVVHPIMCSWKYKIPNQEKRRQEAISWLNTLPLVEN